MAQPPSIRAYLSFAEDAAALAAQLARDLARAGIAVSPYSIERSAGVHEADLAREVEASDVVLSVFSKGSFDSVRCNEEMERALAAQKRVLFLLAQPVTMR